MNTKIKYSILILIILLITFGLVGCSKKGGFRTSFASENGYKTTVEAIPNGSRVDLTLSMEANSEEEAKVAVALFKLTSGDYENVDSKVNGKTCIITCYVVPQNGDVLGTIQKLKQSYIERGCTVEDL